MDDISASVERILKQYNQSVRGSKKIAQEILRVNLGTARYSNVSKIAAESGRFLGQAISSELTTRFPDGKVSYDVAYGILAPTTRKNYDYVSDIAVKVQQDLNNKAGIRLKALKADFPEKRVENLAKHISNKGARVIEQLPDYMDAMSDLSAEDTLSMNVDNLRRIHQIPDQAENLSLSTVDESVRKNADFQYEAGLSPKIIRQTTGACCSWCSDLVGEFDYGEVKHGNKDVFRRHKCCRCIVEFDPGDGSKTRQNVHTKDWRQEYETWEDVAAQKIRIAEENGLTQRELTKRALAGSEDKNNRGEIARRIMNGQYNLNYKHQKYLQHQKDTEVYKNTEKTRGTPQSYLTISEQEAQRLIYQYCGTGTAGFKKGDIDHREYVDTGSKIGYYMDREGNEYETSRVCIVYGHDGSHIFPCNPNFGNDGDTIG